MDHLQPEHDRKQWPAEADQFAENNAEYSLAQTLTEGTHPGVGSTTLQRISQGVMNCESPIQFMDAINAGNSAIGNRALLQFVGRLYQQRQTPDTHAIARAGLKGPSRTLTHQNRIKQAFGHHDISGMREHTDSAARLSLAILGAEGLSSNGRMAVHGVPDLYTQAHEAAHGVQQAALGDGLQLKGSIGEAGDKYERQADAVAAAVVRGESAEGLLDEVAGRPTVVTGSPVTATGPVQMMHTDEEDKDEEEDRARLMMTLIGHAIEVTEGGRWGRGRANPSRPSRKTGASAQATTETKEAKGIPDEQSKMPEIAKKSESRAKSKKGRSAAASKVSAELMEQLIKEIVSLVRNTPEETLKESRGDYTQLTGFDGSPHKAALEQTETLIHAYRRSFNKLCRGGREVPPDFADKLMPDISGVIPGASKKKPERQQTGAKKPGAKGEAKPAKKVPLIEMPGLQDMILCRAINHLITGEVRDLDALIGDEGCQLRTPFILNMYREVQEKLPGLVQGGRDKAIILVEKYREKAGGEQDECIERLIGLDKMRRGKDSKYSDKLDEFISANALSKSMEAYQDTAEGPDRYQYMVKGLTAAMEEHWPGSTEYLKHTCSEGSMSWTEERDVFAIPTTMDRHPLFPDRPVLSKRKSRQADLSKQYMVRVACELLKKRSIEVEIIDKALGYDKSGKLQTDKEFKIARTDKDNVFSMLLHSLQLHTGAASVSAEKIKLVPCWESVYIVFPYALEQGYPFLINLRRVLLSGEGENRQYRSNDLCRTLFYKPTETGYKYEPRPSEEEQKQPALCVTGYSMLREEDTARPGHGTTLAPWVFERDPEIFLAEFTQRDILDLLLLDGASTHPPLNTGTTGASALGFPEGSATPALKKGYKFNEQDDPESWNYARAIHDNTLFDLGQERMTDEGKRWLTSEFELTEEAKKCIIPDQCPINMLGDETKLNIKERYELFLKLTQEAGLGFTRYWMEDKKAGAVIRVADMTVPFSIAHIYTSTFKHEDQISREYAETSRGVHVGTGGMKLNWYKDQDEHLKFLLALESDLKKNLGLSKEYKEALEEVEEHRRNLELYIKRESSLIGLEEDLRG